MNPLRFQPGWPLAAVLLTLLPLVPAQADSLSLDQALLLAERNAPSLQARHEQVSAARSAVLPAGELPDPRLNLGVQNLPVDGSDRWSTSRDFMTMQVIGLAQEVPNRDKRKARVETARAAAERADAEAVIERLKVRAATAQAWIAAYTVQRKLQQFDDFYRENRLLAASVSARLAGGGGAAASALAPSQEAAQLDERKDQLQSLAAQARATLRRWVGQDPDVQAQAFPHWAVDAPEYLQALHGHPALAAYAAMTREAQAQVHQAEAEKQSDWGWQVDYQRRGPDFSNMVSLQLSFQLPLFTGSRQGPMIEARRAQVRQLEDEQQAALREHQAQLEADLAEYQRLQRAVARSRQTLLPLAEDQVRLTLADYRAGKGALSEVLAARRQRVEARLQDIDLQGQLAATAARLHFIYGEGRV
ncbi:TolC family protein [Pseudomonas sichuanensis]|uniref:TolC family protein n=1 Tax=Pseudomonas sichuanensis TaxID=2213015 RepID=UPI00244739DB|nr:TolC family protein [Pseudomonas sichuanensis]MDH0729194.1 TolC family protein [Pseudomonas sichuanensis]MDH1581396.1 TolC family protein [Pseudomonas sichuanensis]MDH1593866.1 TolC family protein [Pseudomonas sichuanensis]MDH1600024.1 TolC family protein [Pseudomonas sichuanensis]